jgi:hypothetical protein
MCDEHTNTVSMISPLKEMMVRALTTLDTDSELIKQAKETIRKDIKSRYADEKVIKILELSCALDPRFRTLPYHTDAEKVDVYFALIQEILKFEQNIQVIT